MNFYTTRHELYCGIDLHAKWSANSNRFPWSVRPVLLVDLRPGDFVELVTFVCWSIGWRPLLLAKVLAC